jgi:hypothetical protein
MQVMEVMVILRGMMGAERKTKNEDEMGESQAEPAGEVASGASSAELMS